MRLEVRKWESIDKVGNLFGLQEKPSFLKKIRAIENMAMNFNDLQAHEVVLPFTESKARTWRDSQAGQNMKLPKFTLTSGGGASNETQAIMRNGYMIWWLQKRDNGLKFVEWGTINNHWKKWRHLARNFWFLLCPKATPATAYGRFVDFVKDKNLKSFGDFDKLFEDLKELGKDVRKRDAIKALKDVTVRHPEFNGLIMFPLDQETKAMNILAEYLKHFGYEVEPAGTFNVLPSFITFLDEVESDTIKTMFAFLRNVRPSPELAQEEEDRLKLIERQVKAGMLMTKWAKEWMIVKKHMRLLAKKVRESNKVRESKKKKVQEGQQKKPCKKKNKTKEELVKYGITLAPKMIEGSDPPQYDSPNPDWLEKMFMVHYHIRAMVDQIGCEYSDSIRTFKEIQAKNLMYEPFTIVGINALFFGKKDMANKHVLAAQLDSWLPTPWRASIREYCIVLYDILLGQFEEDIRDKIDIMVAAYCKRIGKKGDREWFAMILENIRNKKEDPLAFPEEEPEQDKESEALNDEEMEQAVNILTNLKGL